MADRINVFALAVGSLSVAAAVGLAVFAGPFGAPQRMSEVQALDAWRVIAGQEQTMREKAMANFLADRWSQDDDFAASERKAAWDYAASHGVSREDVFRAIDRGLREDWPLPPGAAEPRAAVTPCRPRPIY